MGDLCPTSHNLEIPFVKKTEYQVLSAEPDSGEVSLLTEDGGTKDDLNLPTFVTIGEPTDEDKKVAEEVVTESRRATSQSMSLCKQHVAWRKSSVASSSRQARNGV